MDVGGRSHRRRRWAGIAAGLLAVGLACAWLAVRERAAPAAGDDPYALDPPHAAADGEVEAAAAGIPILCYHYFRPGWSPGYAARVLGAVVLNLPTLDARDFWTVPAAEFERHLRLFRERGVHVVTLPEIVAAAAAGAPVPQPAVVITIDDADASVYALAWPLLRRYGYRAHLFVPTAKVGRSWQGLQVCSWEQLRQMSESGTMLIESHTHDLHWKLETPRGWEPAFLHPGRLAAAGPADDGSVLDEGAVADAGDAAAAGDAAELPPAMRSALGGTWGAVARDLLASRRAITAQVGRAPGFLAWPYGFASAALDSVAAAAGFAGTLSLKPRPFHDASAWHIGRYAVSAKTTPQRLFEFLPAAGGPRTARAEAGR